MTIARVAMHAQLDAVFQRVALVLVRDAPKQRRQRNRRNLHPLGVLVEAQRAHQPVELLGQPGDGSCQIVNAFKHFDEPKLFNFNAASPDFIFKIGDVTAIEALRALRGRGPPPRPDRVIAVQRPRNALREYLPV